MELEQAKLTLEIRKIEVQAQTKTTGVAGLHSCVTRPSHRPTYTCVRRCDRWRNTANYRVCP